MGTKPTQSQHNFSGPSLSPRGRCSESLQGFPLTQCGKTDSTVLNLPVGPEQDQAIPSYVISNQKNVRHTKDNMLHKCYSMNQSIQKHPLFRPSLSVFSLSFNLHSHSNPIPDRALDLYMEGETLGCRHQGNELSCLKLPSTTPNRPWPLG